MKKYDKIIYDELLEKKLASEEALDAIVKESETSGQSVQQVLIQKGLFSEKDLLNILGERLKLDVIDLNAVSVDKAILEKVPVKIASYYKLLPVKISGRVLTIAVSSPMDIKIQDEIRTQLGYNIEIVLCQKADMVENSKKYYGMDAQILDGMKSPDSSAPQLPLQEVSDDEVVDIEKIAGDASVIKLVNQIIVEGWKKRSTDIHIEPQRGGISLRYRIDGILYDMPVSAGMKNYFSAIISRIKIMSNLNIVERRLPQDGRGIVKVQNQMLDLRISTIPTPFGESMVIRILPAERIFSLEKLGLMEQDLGVFESLIRKPHGIIFITGPTGSGKTTTLYACLNRINTKERKIITLEDPIEYEMAGITQMQVLSEIGLDFARGLRSILRHDPDVIMLGEVRDLETAGIAIRVALTGHLIFSTLHTNDAASGVTRLVDIGLEPYLVASSVEAFIAQRLVRLICTACREEEKGASLEVKNQIAGDLDLNPDKIKLYRGKGCPECNSTGFFGRTAIYEVLLVEEEIKDLILKKTSSDQIKKVAVSRGMRILRQDGWQKVLQGLTTAEEVMQVAPAGKPPVRTKNTISTMDRSGADEQEADQGRRVYPRLSATVNLRYKVFESEADVAADKSSEEFRTVTKNISAGGLLLVTDYAYPVGSIFEVVMEIPDKQEPIQCLSRLVRIEEEASGQLYEIAVCFLDITSAQKARLSRFIESKMG